MCCEVSASFIFYVARAKRFTRHCGIPDDMALTSCAKNRRGLKVENYMQMKVKCTRKWCSKTDRVAWWWTRKLWRDVRGGENNGWCFSNSPFIRPFSTRLEGQEQNKCGLAIYEYLCVVVGQCWHADSDQQEVAEVMCDLFASGGSSPLSAWAVCQLRYKHFLFCFLKLSL